MAKSKKKAVPKKSSSKAKDVKKTSIAAASKPKKVVTKVNDKSAAKSVKASVPKQHTTLPAPKAETQVIKQVKKSLVAPDSVKVSERYAPPKKLEVKKPAVSEGKSRLPTAAEIAAVISSPKVSRENHVVRTMDSVQTSTTPRVAVGMGDKLQEKLNLGKVTDAISRMGYSPQPFPVFKTR